MATKYPLTMAQSCMQTYADQIHTLADKRERQAAGKRISSFHSWAKDKMASGPAPIFAMTKVNTWTHSQVKRHGEVSAHPQAIADSQMDIWNNIWEGKKITKEADSTKYFVDSDKGGDTDSFSVDHLLDKADQTILDDIAKLPHHSLPVPTVEEVRYAAKSFRWKTGLGHDGIPPRAWALLSDSALAMVLYVLWAAESGS